MGEMRAEMRAEMLTAESVLALAPDPSSAAAGVSQASPLKWTGSGQAGPLLWGHCQGSGKKPYQAIVDLGGPAYQCSCPSRKFPCKHSLGLMLLAAAGQVPAAVPPDFAASWLAARSVRASRAENSARPVDAEAAAARAAQRVNRVREGLGELDRWLTDQVRTGLASIKGLGYPHFDRIAARMVDAQAPAISGTLRNLAAVPAAGGDWPARLLAEFALLRLLIRAHERVDELAPELKDTVRAHIGYPVGREDVLAAPSVRDRWLVMAVRDSDETRLKTRRVWVQGRTTGRPALLLSFAPTGQPLDGSLVAGTVLDADLHFYPGALPLRALVGERHSDAAPAGPTDRPAARRLSEMLDEIAAALAADPWLRSWPVAVVGTPVADGDRRLIVDGDAAFPALLADDQWWRLLAISGGEAVPLVGEWTPSGLAVLAVAHTDSLVAL